MARPRKQTVDYFPHDTDASHRKTLTIIQNKYGNDGYAFWYKLLELLGRTPGHFYNFKDPADWEFLIAETHISDTEKANDILETLAILQAIDPGLHKEGVIWSQNFVDRLEDVYIKREKSKPDKPISGEKTTVSGAETLVSGGDNPQTKLNKTKLNEIETKESSSLSEEIISLYKKMVGLHEEESLDEVIENEIKAAINIFPPEWVHDAIQEAIRQNKKKWSYVAGILNNWRRFGRGKKKGIDPDKYIRGKYGHMVQR
jgi:DnaD/phage-associated family protein